MNNRANPMTSYPYPIEGAQCPLLVAVWPLRYAVGVDPGIDADALNLPALVGNFPALESEQARAIPMHYSRRLLRDGWLYLWQEGQRRLIEYDVNNAYLNETERGGAVIDSRTLPYFILPAGESARLVWTPVRWTDEQFSAALGQNAVRARVMRAFSPGLSPVSDFITGQSDTLAISDYISPDDYEWSNAPAAASRPDFIRTIFAMNHCEQQAWALVDDPWGVVHDLAALTRHRQSIHETYMHEHAEDWAMAGVLRSLAESDQQLAGKMNNIANTRRLNQVWYNMDTVEARYAEDIATLTECWANWFNTTHGSGLATLDTACGHFDITTPGHREALEDSFAAACLGVSDKPKGLIAVQHLLTLPTAPQKPWLIWTLLGLGERLDAGQLSSILGLGEIVGETVPEALSGAARMAQAAALSASLNLAAVRLRDLGPAVARDPLFAALAPAVSLQIRNWPTPADPISKTYMVGALGRSAQQLEVVHATHRDVGEWMGRIVGTTAPPANESVTRATSSVMPMFKPIPMAIEPIVGQASGTGPIMNPGSLTANTARSQQIIDFSNRALREAPLRSLIALLAAVNLVMASSELKNERSVATASATLGGIFGIIAAGTAIAEKMREVDWRREARSTSITSHGTKTQLANTLRAGIAVQTFSGIVAATNIVLFGSEAVDAYRQGDIDTASLSAGLSAASAGQLALQVKAFRAYRAARAAVLLGQMSALRAGTAVLGGPMTFAIASITSLILGGLVIRQYTQDTPFEKWVSGTRFGVSPGEWSSSYRSEMEHLYLILYPISLRLERYPELNPRTGSHVQVTWLILRLQGQQRIGRGMIRFEGKEIWRKSGLFGQNVQVPAQWTEKDFDLDSGTRRSGEAGVARYRRVYHPEPQLGQLVRIEGQLFYSPIEGFELPHMDIKDSAWI